MTRKMDGLNVRTMHIPDDNTAHEDWAYKYMDTLLDDASDDVIQKPRRSRNRRAVDPQKTTCELYMQVTYN